MMARRIRVAHVITGLVLGGGGQVMWTIARNFDKSRFDADVYCIIGGGELVEDIEALGMPVRIIPAHVASSVLKYQPMQVLELARCLRRGNYDVVHTHLFQADVIGGIAARLAGIPRIVKSLHNMGGWKKRHHLWIDRALATDRVICCSDYLAQSATRQEGLDPARVVTIHHGVDPSRFQVNVQRAEYLAALGLDPRRRVVGTIGRPIAEKGHEYLLGAIPQILAAHSDAQFLIVGEGPLREQLQAQVARLGLQDRVKLPGARPDIAELLSVMDLFVFPSVSEGLGIAILEAMAARVPIVASRIRPLTEMISDGENGVLVEPRNALALAEAVNGMLGDRARAEAIRDRAFEHVSTTFSERRMVAAVERVYDELCVGRSCNADVAVPAQN
jgi:glycosyltransferase involved in cell wall biosynthesis